MELKIEKKIILVRNKPRLVWRTFMSSFKRGIFESEESTPGRIDTYHMY